MSIYGYTPRQHPVVTDAEHLETFREMLRRMRFPGESWRVQVAIERAIEMLERSAS